jgi:ubiquinone/menaquinone biosynthesis C-methylase UbiE
MISNKLTWESPEIVREYISVNALQKPEQTILTMLKDSLKDMRMLDIGVGGGRTTWNFAPLVKEYVGIDYSETMIKACQERFLPSDKVTFIVSDAREMKKFQDNYFDFALFSFNGIDFVPHEERITVLREINRVIKNNGLFYFSTHNIYGLRKIYSIALSANLRILMRSIKRYWLVLWNNGFLKKFINREWVVINDGTHRFRLTTYYSKPSVQMTQLNEAGFHDIHVYSLDSGLELNLQDTESVQDFWLYYLCRKR